MDQDCKTTLLYDIGAIQGPAFSIGVACSAGTVLFCSANLERLFSCDPFEWIGHPAECLPEELALPLIAAHGLGRHLFVIRVRGQDRPAVLDCSGDLKILEIGDPEPIKQQEHWWGHNGRTAFLKQMQRKRTSELFGKFAVDWLFETSGYDRVMLYRFLPNWDGEVTYEHCRPGIEGYLGLRFPAGDIPENARHLFILNPHRVIPDIEAEPVPLLAAAGSAHSVDLTRSWFRAVHPVHLIYLRNMDVRASLTISIVVNGKLWGLLACHHREPRNPPFQDRLAYDEIAELVSLHFGSAVMLQEHEERSALEQKLAPLLQAEPGETETKYLLAHHLGTVRSAFAASGTWLHLEGEDFFDAHVPGVEGRSELLRLVEQEETSDIFSYDSLPIAFQSSQDLIEHASGALLIRFTSRDFLLLFRPEIVSTLRWAGKPRELETVIETPLRPRSSFQCWAQEVRFTAEPWGEINLNMADQLRQQVLLRIHNARLARVAQHDPLTGLGNRRLFERRLAQELRNAAENGACFAVHLIDLDRFKQVNDTLGHSQGDEVLKAVSSRLQALRRSRDALVRLGGDEFAIIQSGIPDAAAAAILAEKVVDALCGLIELQGAEVQVGASVGVALYPDHGVTQADLVEHADRALYSVKRGGRNGFFVYGSVHSDITK